MPYFWPYRPKVGISGHQPKKQGKKQPIGLFFLPIIYRGQICPTFGLTGQKQVFPATGQEKQVKKQPYWLFFQLLAIGLDMPCRYFRPLAENIDKKQPNWLFFIYYLQGLDMPYFWPYRPKVGISGRWAGRIGVKKQPLWLFFYLLSIGARYALQVFPAASQKIE